MHPGFAFAKLVGLFSLADGVLIDWAEGSKHDHESKLFRRLWARIEAGDIVLGDRAYGTFVSIAGLLGQGVDSVMRTHQRRIIDF